MIKINGDKFTIYEVEDIYKKFVLEMNNYDNVAIDMKGVHKIDMVAIQLLLSTKKSCEENSKKFELLNISDEVKKNIFLCRCDTLLGLSDG